MTKRKWHNKATGSQWGIVQQWGVNSDGGEKKQRAEVELRIRMLQSKWILSLFFLTMLQFEGKNVLLHFSLLVSQNFIDTWGFSRSAGELSYWCLIVFTHSLVWSVILWSGWLLSVQPIVFLWFTWNLRFHIFFIFLTAAITESTRRLVQAHSEATLPCENVKLGQKQCKGTTWIFLSKTSYVELFHYGEVTEDGKEKSDRLRLSLSENCSLVIKNVTAEDVGSYTCQQWRGTKESTGDTKLAENSVVYLSVVTGE